MMCIAQKWKPLNNLKEFPYQILVYIMPNVRTQIAENDLGHNYAMPIVICVASVDEIYQ